MPLSMVLGPKLVNSISKHFDFTLIQEIHLKASCFYPMDYKNHSLWVGVEKPT